MTKKPIIGITLDSQPEGGYSTLPWYALRKEYFKSVAMHGGAPLGIPHEMTAIEDYLDSINGLIISGGDFDIPPELYGENNIHQKVRINDERTAFEWKLTTLAIQRNIPILGICAGQQLLNVILGGTLIQYIPDEIEGAQEHQQPTERTQAWHGVSIKSDTLLHKIVNCEIMEVNSRHQQAVKTVGDDVVINAVAPDGVIEGIEYKKHPFCLGIQWHPEVQVSAGDSNIIAALVQAASAQ